MPAQSEKQRRFFGLVHAVQKGEKAPHEVSPQVRKVAGSISKKDAADFASSTVKELRVKKAVLSILKDIHDPMYLDEGGTETGQINPIAKEFHVKDDFQSYIKKYLGQPLSPKEMEAINTLKEVKPTKVERTAIWYETSDDFQNSTTTVVKKMKDGNQFSFNAFQKHTSAKPEEEKPEEQPPAGPEAGVPPQGTPGAEQSIGQPGQQPPATPAEPEAEVPEAPEKDDIIVTKSVLFNDEIKGGAILVEFLKKLDL